MISRSRSAESRPPVSKSNPSTAGALILLLATLPLGAQQSAPAQRGGAPRADTPQLVVSVLASADPKAGVAAADAIRRRIQSEHSATDLYVVPRTRTDQMLSSSGFNPDSALGTSEIVELTRNVHGDYALAGTVERTPAGVRTSVRLLTQTGARIVAEPLPPVDGADFGDIAKQVDREVSRAIRALVFYHDCTNALRAGDYQTAMTAAEQGLRIRPTSAMLNSCLLTVLSLTKAAPDSIIAVASIVAAADSASVVAWANLADAYAERGDGARARQALLTVHRLEPANTRVTLRVVDDYVAAAQPDSAAAVLDAALADASSNPDLLEKKWLLDLLRRRYREALADGAALVAADSAAATPDFYERQLVAAKESGDTVAARQLALAASTRFPRSAEFLLVLARDAVDRGVPKDALGFVERVLAIEPANAKAWQLAIAAQAKSNGADSAFATARRAIAAAVPADSIAASVAAVVAPAVVAAQVSRKRSDEDAALGAAQTADSLAPSPRNSFYLGVAAFQVVDDEVQTLAAFANRRSPALTRAERQTACSSAKHVEDLVSISTSALRTGGRVDPEPAGKIMTVLPSFSDFAASVKRTNCR